VTSAKDNDAGERLADELTKPLPRLARRRFGACRACLSN
jgi:hypothetical protein